MAARGNRNRMIIATKVGRCPGQLGLSAKNIRAGAEASLKRLNVDRIDLYYAHADDLNTPIEETLREFDALVREGKVRHVAASNFTAARLSAALATSAREGLVRYVALQPHYNLVVRKEYEGDLSDVCAREGVACMPYFALAMGFLTGKYRPGSSVQSARAEGARKYLDERGQRILTALDDIAATHDTTVAAVSLAWLRDRPTVAAPIASARTVAQLSELLPMATLTLTADETRRLEEQ
jgi:aryl-alcohol dehydrogenase (NADP+)